MAGFLFTHAPLTISVSKSASAEYVARLVDDDRVARKQADIGSFVWICALLRI
jgi:hypothetical protein